MLIQIQEGIVANQWIVTLDDYPVICRSWQEASEFADRMQARLDAPHTLPQEAAVLVQERAVAQTH